LSQAIEFLKGKGPGHEEILIFSDMKEDLAKGYGRTDLPRIPRAPGHVAR
jgi:hypothetical protein